MRAPYRHMDEIINSSDLKSALQSVYNGNSFRESATKNNISPSSLYKLVLRIQGFLFVSSKNEMFTELIKRGYIEHKG